jgi:acyl-CoA synthetase (AMP-forming)/AMP-acid ligase II
MLKVGGENVSAEEVETILLGHPKVQMCAVISAPDPRLHEVVMAVVQLKRGEDETEESVIRFCAERMANFRVPRYVRFVKEWPMTGSGKIQRHVLRDQFLATLPT